jgi:hypothetical protein
MLILIPWSWTVRAIVCRSELPVSCTVHYYSAVKIGDIRQHTLRTDA